MIRIWRCEFFVQIISFLSVFMSGFFLVFFLWHRNFNENLKMKRKKEKENSNLSLCQFQTTTLKPKKRKKKKEKKWRRYNNGRMVLIGVSAGTKKRQIDDNDKNWRLTTVEMTIDEMKIDSLSLKTNVSATTIRIEEEWRLKNWETYDLSCIVSVLRFDKKKIVNILCFQQFKNAKILFLNF